MVEKPAASLQPSPVQIRYARVLEKGMYVGLASLLVTFTLYVCGIMGPYVPLDKVTEYWANGVHQYLDEADIKAGWAWVPMVGYGDFVNFIGIAVLAGVSVLCYGAIIPLLLSRRDFVYAALALAEVVVLVVAASGVISIGH